MTINELAAKSDRSVASIVDWALGTRSAGAPRRSEGPGRPRKATNGVVKSVNTRTAAGRERYEAAVLDVVRNAKGPIRAPEIRARVGGTPQQARAALNRLIETGSVGFEGKARATAYTPA
jgi:hypothetical protein